MNKRNFQLKDILILFFILLIALVFRLYKINTPLADLHSWRQADTAAVARNYVKNGIDLLHPRYDDLSSIETGLENPQGYRMVEFPIYNAIVAFVAKLLPFTSVEIYGRLISAFFSLMIIGIIYYLLFKESGRIAAIGAAIVYSVFPFFVFFSRVVLPETTALAFTFISILFLYLCSSKKNSSAKDLIFLLVSSVFFAMAILIKPTVIFFSITLFYLFFQKFNLKFFRKISFYLFFIIAFVPFVLWRNYIKNFPEGVPASDWLITSVNTYEGLKNIFLRPAFFRWIFYERLSNVILGGYLTFFLILGIIKKSSNYFFHTILISGLVYLFVFEGGNTQHIYYQTLILPAVAIFLGLGVEYLNTNKKNLLSGFMVVPITLIVSSFGFAFSYYTVKDYYNYPQDITQMAKIIKTLSKDTDKVVTDTTGDTTLLYLSDRKGAPSLYKDPPTLSKLGYNYMIIFNKDYIKQLKKERFVPIFENNNFTMFKL